jgi:hypothetical protein
MSDLDALGNTPEKGAIGPVSTLGLGLFPLSRRTFVLHLACVFPVGQEANLP